MDNQIIYDYYYNFKYYKVLVTYKRMRSIVYRYDAETEMFKVSAPFRASQRRILKYLDKFAPKLLAKSSKHISPISGDLIYIFGRQLPIVIGKKNELAVDHLSLKKRENLNKVLKMILKNYLIEKVKYYESVMNLKSHKLSVKNMRSRHASNSSNNHNLSFATSLVHYSPNTIDSVIIHELVHDIYFDHSKAFYNTVLKYCPNYKMYKKALDNTNYSYE